MGQSPRYWPGWGQPTSQLCGSICRRGVGEGTMPLPGCWWLAQNSPSFQSLHPLPIWDWCPSSCCPSGGSQSWWVCISSRTVWALWMDSPEKPAVSSFTPTLTGFYSQKLWGFIPQRWNPGLHNLAWGWDRLLLRYPSWFYPLHVNMRLPVPLATTTTALLLPQCILSPWLPISAPSAHLDEYGFFKSLVVRYPYSLTFWQFWVFFVLRLVVVFLKVVQGREVNLPTPPWWLEVLGLLQYFFYFCVCSNIHEPISIL